MDERLYTVKQVAELLQVHKHTVYRWIWSGKIKAVKIGNLVRIPEKEVKRLVGGKGVNNGNK